MQKYAEFNDNKIKHLEMIQDVIKRMASNSFSLKGWTVALYSALIIFFLKDFKESEWISLILVLPAILMAALDSYYLTLERRYRDLYNSILGGSKSIEPFELRLPNLSKKEKINQFFSSVASISILLYYGTFIIFSGIVIGYIICV